METPIVTSESKNLTPTITVEEVRNWYEKTLAEQKGTSSLREDSILLIDVGPRWLESLNGFSLTTDEFLITPLTLSASQQHSQFKLLTTRQADGSLTGKLAIYTPTEAYHIAKNGKYSVSDFTGTVLYTDLLGKFEYGHYIENGLYKGQAFAKSRDRPNTNTLGVRECTTISYSICIDFDYNPGQVLRLGCMYTVDVVTTTCTSGSTAGSGNGSGGMGSGGGGGAWNSSQPTNLFSTSEIEALRTKFRNANLDDIFYTLELHQGLLKAANSFLDARGWDNLNKPAVENLVNTTGEYAALAGYLTALSVYTNFYNANVNTNTLVSTFTAFATYHKAGFTTEEFLELYANADLFRNAAPYLIENNFDVDSKDYIRKILKNLKDAKDIATPTSSFCSKQDLYDYVKNSSTICPNCNEGQLQDKIGTMFENAFNEWQLAYNVGNYEPNTNDAFRRFSPSRNADVAPDGFMKSIRHPTLGQLGVDQKAHWVECKASNKNVLGLADYTGQIKGEIEALAEYQPWACANHMAAISYVTTIDMIPSPKLIDYANARGIWILQSYASFEIRSDGKMYLTFASVYPHRTQFGEPFPIPTMAALKQSLTSNYVEFK